MNVFQVLKSKKALLTLAMAVATLWSFECVQMQAQPLVHPPLGKTAEAIDGSLKLTLVG